MIQLNTLSIVSKCSIYRQIDDRACCPVCNYLLSVENVLDPGFQSETVSVADDADNALLSGENVKGGASAKSEKLIEFLNGTEPGVKSLVFSQVSQVGCPGSKITSFVADSPHPDLIT